MIVCMQDTETPTTKLQGRGKSSNSILSADICLLYVVLRMQTCCPGVCRTYIVHQLGCCQIIVFWRKFIVIRKLCYGGRCGGALVVLALDSVYSYFIYIFAFHLSGFNIVLTLCCAIS